MVLITLAGLPGCREKRETIFDRVVSIPKEFVLDVPYLPPLCDELSGLKKGFVDIPGGKLYYEEEGYGIPLILLNPGPGGSHQNFHPYFSRLNDIARVIYYDTRGVGKSTKDETGATYTIQQSIEDLEFLRRTLGIDKWVVCGWSFGGFLAQCYALTYPERLIGLVLIASGHGDTNVKLKPGRERMFISQAELDALQKIDKAFNEGKLNQVQTGYNKDLAGYWKFQGHYKPTREESIREAYIGPDQMLFKHLICRQMWQINLDNKFDDFEVPTLLAEAKWDLTWDTDKAEFMRKAHPNAQFELFEKSGHAIFADEPDKFFAIVRKFLEKTVHTKIVYKPGHRITLPEPPTGLELKLAAILSLSNQEEKEKKLLAVYQQAVKENIADASAWKELAFVFRGSEKSPETKHAAQALDAFNRYERYATQEELQESEHCLYVWRAQLLEALGKRAEAVKNYQEALRKFKQVSNSCAQANRAWLEERIKKLRAT